MEELSKKQFHEVVTDIQKKLDATQFVFVPREQMIDLARKIDDLDLKCTTGVATHDKDIFYIQFDPNDQIEALMKEHGLIIEDAEAARPKVNSIVLTAHTNLSHG